MKKPISILFCIVTLFSCVNSNKGQPITETSTIQEEPVIVEPSPILFTDMIPEQLSDSAKTLLIKKITNNIDADTSLIGIKIADSNAILYAFYRNDTLVKMVEGSLFHGSAYYFLMNHLICVKESCLSNEVSAMCDPFQATETSFLYNKRLIQQDFYSSRNVGFFCSCNFGTLLNQHSGSSDEPQQALMLYVNQMLNKIETSQYH